MPASPSAPASMDPPAAASSRLKRVAHRRPRRILDMGTGSGILAMAAASLLHRAVLATDIEPWAVRVANENARLNRLGAPGYRSAGRRLARPVRPRPWPVRPRLRQHPGPPALPDGDAPGAGAGARGHRDPRRAAGQPGALGALRAPRPRAAAGTHAAEGPWTTLVLRKRARRHLVSSDPL